MTETARYQCEAQGHVEYLRTDAENSLCTFDRSPLVPVEAAEEPAKPAGPDVPATSTEPLRPVHEMRITFADTIVAVVPGTQVMLGRDPEYSPYAEFFGRNTHVSRRHAVLGVERDGRAWIRDFYSTNLTMVAGEPLKPGAERDVRHGDQIRLCAAITGTVDLIRKESHDS